jgi:sugar lactone lactonase YvrE
MQRLTLRLLILSSALCCQASAQTYDTNNVVVQTFAGSGFSGYLDGQGTQTMFNVPLAITADTSSNLFVMDYSNSRIRKITPDGAVSTFAGGGPGSLPGSGTNVSLPSAITMTIDHSNTLYLVEYSTGTAMVRIGSDGYVSRIPLPGVTGTGAAARDGICVDSENNVYISDLNGNKIYRYRTNGVLEVFAGSGNSGSIDGNGIFTSFASPSALTADSADNIYVWDSGNKLIRRINQNRDVVTIAGHQGISDSDGSGTNASFYLVSAICADGVGNIYMACYSSTGGESIRRMTAATNVTTVAGNFTQHGYTNGPGNLARFNGAGDEGICLSGGTLFLADAFNHRIRQISFNPSEQQVSNANLNLKMFPGLKITGTVGRSYRVESSTNLSNWISEATILLTRTPYPWIDENGEGQKKFYRAILLP